MLRSPGVCGRGFDTLPTPVPVRIGRIIPACGRWFRRARRCGAVMGITLQAGCVHINLYWAIGCTYRVDVSTVPTGFAGRSSTHTSNNATTGLWSDERMLGTLS